MPGHMHGGTHRSHHPFQAVAQVQRPLVRVQTSCGGVFHAPRVVITLPLGVLQSGSVAFSPPLPLAAPAKASALSRLGTGIYNKVCILCAAIVETVSCISVLPIPTTRNRFNTHQQVQRSGVLALKSSCHFTCRCKHQVMLVFEEAFWDNAVMIHRIPTVEERGRCGVAQGRRQLYPINASAVALGMPQHHVASPVTVNLHLPCFAFLSPLH